MCTGKVAYALMAERDERETPAAVVRVEQLYPFPQEQLDEILSSYPNAEEVVWVQEEPRNMGAWTFMNARLRDHLGDGVGWRCVSRPESGSPATGSASVHEHEQRALINEALT